MSRYAHLTSRDEICERIGAWWHDQCSDLAVIGDLDGLPIGDMTQDVTALIAHLAMRDGPHVAQRSTQFRWASRATLDSLVAQQGRPGSQAWQARPG